MRGFVNTAMAMAMAGAALLCATTASGATDVGALGENGWKSNDSRSAAGANLRGLSYSHAGLGGVYTAADDVTIAGQIRFVPEGRQPSLTGMPLTLTGTDLGNGALELYGTALNTGKSNLTRRDMVNGFGPSSDLLLPGFFFNYRQFTIADTTFRTPGMNISVLGNNSNVYVFVYTDPAHTTFGVWTTSNVTGATPVFLFGPGAPGGGGGTRTFAQWQTDPTWGPILFGGTAKIVDVGFTIGSSQRLAYVYLDWVETSILDGGTRNDFVYEAPAVRLTTTPCTNSNTVDVSVDLTGTPGNAFVGSQMFLQYNTARLTYNGVTGYTSDPLFPTTPLHAFNLGAGTIDFANGVFGGGPGAAGPHHIVTFHFTRVGETCVSDGLELVEFRPHVPPTRLSDSLGQEVAAAYIDLPPFSIDVTPPSITCPPNITVNADAPGCFATLDYINEFDVAPTLSATQAPGVYYVDRFAPAGFTSAVFLGQPRLKHSIAAADHQPPALNFYNTQGRKLDIDMPTGETLGIDIYIDPAWIGMAPAIRRADLWATAFDGKNDISAYPIIGFTSNDPLDPNNGSPANPTPRWRVWDNVNGVWIDLALPVTAGWHRIETQLTASSFVHKIDAATVHTFSGLDSVRFGNTIIQAFNFGQSYDVHWDNLTTGPIGPVMDDLCSTSGTVTYVRSDDAMLTLHDPFPSGMPTTITWTATDCSGNSSTCLQTVTVNAVNIFNATVELKSVDPTMFTRCIRFEFYGTCPTLPVTVSQVMTFSGGVGTAAIPIPCGTYTCVTATDPLHTLRRTANPTHFGVSGITYHAEFVNTSAMNDDSLLGGNLNDDLYVDVLDFGAYVGQFGVTYGSVNTNCATPYPHADISGNGSVTILDYTFISNNFLTFREPDCCSVPLQDAGPVSDITVEELVARGEWKMAATSDLNRDGRVNVGDIAHLLQNGPARCAADFDGMNGVSIDDLFVYINSWMTGHPACDMTGDRSVSIDDLFVYINAWMIGCN